MVVTLDNGHGSGTSECCMPRAANSNLRPSEAAVAFMKMSFCSPEDQQFVSETIVTSLWLIAWLGSHQI